MTAATMRPRIWASAYCVVEPTPISCVNYLMTDTDREVARQAREMRASQKAEDGARAMADHEKLMRNQRTNMERLRALRLARDAEVAAAIEAAPVVKPVKTKKKVAK